MGKHHKDRQDDSYSRQYNGYFTILSASSGKWSRCIQTGPVPHLSWAGGVNARIVDTLHDEIIVEARDGIEDQVEAIVKESMVEALKRIIPEIPFVVEPRMANSWKS
jgi:hypothetical protein